MDANERRIAELQADNARMAQELARYRGYMDPAPPPPKQDGRPVHVVLVPDATTGSMPSEAIDNVSRVWRDILAKHHPELDVRRERDIQRIPAGATAAWIVGPAYLATRDDDGRIELRRTARNEEESVALDRIGALFDQADHHLKEAERIGNSWLGVFHLKAFDERMACFELAMQLWQRGNDEELGVLLARPDPSPSPAAPGA